MRMKYKAERKEGKKFIESKGNCYAPSFTLLFIWFLLSTFIWCSLISSNDERDWCANKRPPPFRRWGGWEGRREIRTNLILKVGWMNGWAGEGVENVSLDSFDTGSSVKRRSQGEEQQWKGGGENRIGERFKKYKFDNHTLKSLLSPFSGKKEERNRFTQARDWKVVTVTAFIKIEGERWGGMIKGSKGRWRWKEFRWVSEFNEKEN